MPVMPPGNALFRSYIDQQGRYHSVYIGTPPTVCPRCGRTTYRTASDACPWGALCLPKDHSAVSRSTSHARSTHGNANKESTKGNQ